MKRKTSFSLNVQTLRYLTTTAARAGINRSALLEIIVREARLHSELIRRLTAEPLNYDPAKDGERRSGTDRRSTPRIGPDRRKNWPPREDSES
jgi:chromatin segregation and condensation protein Rec8/ScpA/Scc1 (kleisin family)